MQNNLAIYWIETEKVVPNPYQPRVDFDEYKLRDLADSIRQYGVLQPLVVNKAERIGSDGNMSTVYELIAGERRLRASKMAGMLHIPAVVRDGAEKLDDRTKFELAIIENVQREDLNPVERARAFKRLQTEFGLRHSEIAQRVGRSREYVTNSIRLLVLPDEIIDAMSAGALTEGHARPLLTLYGRPEEQKMLFNEIVHRNLTVRDAEMLSKRIVGERFRQRGAAVPTSDTPPTHAEHILEKRLGSMLGVPIRIDTEGDSLIIRLSTTEAGVLCDTLEGIGSRGTATVEIVETDSPIGDDHERGNDTTISQDDGGRESEESGDALAPPRKKKDDDLYSFEHFSI